MNSHLFTELLSQCIEIIADKCDVRCMGMLTRVCRTTRDLLGNSKQCWHSIGRRICGAEYWDSGLKRWKELLDRESPSHFTCRMIYPWTQSPPRLLDPFANTIALPTDQRIAWRLRMDDDENEQYLVIDTQTLTEEGAYAYWLHDDPWGNINATHRILSRPPGEISIKETSQPHGILPAPALFEELRLSAHNITYNNRTYCSISSLPLRCWHIHAGVAAIACEDLHDDAGCVAFSTTQAPYRLLHAVHLPGETSPSAGIVISRPAELWVLERWAEPQSRLLYYGP